MLPPCRCRLLMHCAVAATTLTTALPVEPKVLRNKESFESVLQAAAHNIHVAQFGGGGNDEAALVKNDDDTGSCKLAPGAPQAKLAELIRRTQQRGGGVGSVGTVGDSGVGSGRASQWVTIPLIEASLKV